MGPKTQELLEVLDKLIQMLDADGQIHWSDWMSKARKLILESDFGGVEKVLGAYGGMGSFNDTYLKNITKQNESFSNLQTRAWELAIEIKQEYESNT
ncbi:DUF6966 domain-containing protein [Vibrio lentus]|uniref:DUF6966 domain-containing protein n=1 Tax=Vibrio lentus TaxID=136468 RepID=UPI000C8222B2|nr:hypothetical protein [Vibrio lentus]PMG71225.1 hypothetical protein BCU86_23405 [Vibrio lentus]PMH93546.1 hypothetical protein BCU56_22220 [Vibrio lentus]PMJ02196.1 hypothetical protein BCU32_22850 [Vibrio lentus]